MKRDLLSALVWVQKLRSKLSARKFKRLASPVCLISIFKSCPRKINSPHQTRFEWRLRIRAWIQITTKREIPQLLQSQTLREKKRKQVVQAKTKEASHLKLIFTPHKFKSKWQIRNYPKKTQIFWLRTTNILNLRLTKTTKMKSLKRLLNKIKYGLIPGSLCPIPLSRYPKTSTKRDYHSILQRRAILTS